jgi:tRNA uridine 5-carboxymethylaminomethyl modification enzyme
MNNFDVIVVGGGHAGLEASLSSSRLGANTLLVTLNADSIAYMPCNPAMGGAGKSQVIAELHALGGASGELAEQSATSIRLLNRSKGPAVQSVRIQCDRHLYSLLAHKKLEEMDNLILIQGRVENLLLSDGKIIGVKLADGREFTSKAVVLTCGTYMRGRVHLADESVPGGRLGQPSVENLSIQLAEIGLPVRRFNTGTTPRIDSRSVKYSELNRQEGDTEPIALVSEPMFFKNQLASHIGHTNSKTMDVIRKYMHLAPSVQGRMVRTGPRTCPSLEEKVRWFADRSEHLFFLEPESRYTFETYLQGLYMSIPPEFQLEALKTLPGLANVIMIRPGYAIDYDFVDPQELNQNLSTKHFDNLFLAGQLHGTTGYDEAGALGLVAGANAAHYALMQEPLILTRFDGYIGVMIDDLINKGVTEPYRITPSHVEFRMSVRADNAMFRLGNLADKKKLLDIGRSQELKKMQSDRDILYNLIEGVVYTPSKDMKNLFNDLRLGDINEAITLKQVIKRPGTSYTKLTALFPSIEKLSRRAVYSSMVDISFETYSQRETVRMRDLMRWEKLTLPNDMDYLGNILLSKLARERLHAVKPVTFGQAMRVEGVTPSDLEVIGRFVSRETIE